MKLKLSLVSGARTDDLLVTVDATATVGALAERLSVSHPSMRSPMTAGSTLTLRVQRPGTAERTVDPQLTIAEAGIRSGDPVTLTNDTSRDADARHAATLNVHRGVDAGKAFGLGHGTTFVGRDRECGVRLLDPQVSKRHMRVNVSDVVEIIDENSANGVLVGGERVLRAVLRNGDVAELGGTLLSVTLHSAQAAATAIGSTHAIEFNRSPRLDPQYVGLELVAPDPPARMQHQRFPFIPLIAPVLMAGILFAVTRNALSILFIALSPIMIVGSFLENRISGKKAFERATADFRSSLKDLVVQLQFASELEQEGRRREHPSVAEVAEGVRRLAPVTWTRRPEHRSYLQVRLGLGVQPTRNSVRLPTTNNTSPQLWRELTTVVEQFSTVDRVPVVASLRDCGGLAVAGSTTAAHPVAAAIVAQFVGLHSPADLVLAAVVSVASVDRWEWLKWLPHAGSEHSPLACEHLASTAATAVGLISALEDLVETREAERRREDEIGHPAMLLIVEDDAAHERARLVTLAERGPAHGLFVMWIGPSLERVPAPCRAYVEIDQNTGVGTAGFVDSGVGVPSIELEPIAAGESLTIARALAPLVDAGALLEDQSDLPRAVSFLTLGGHELGESPDDVIEHWRGSNSLPPELGAQRLKKDNTLRALVGQSATDRFYLDLRTHGPHALLGGTTGAGKSEFLQSWILGMSVAHSPARVNFLFVDYKGGAAFADCVNLPHSVGLVTDLSPHMVRRALRSLKAELTRREHILNHKKAKDLVELERRRDPEAPPSLVIVVDEFAALVSEVPEFVDGVVNIAQRGRSLGLHLILATQRPAGVIKDNLRANTNLRIALRMADEADSDDVIGTALASSFDPALPGRAVAKTGPGRLTSFQAAYVGGYTSKIPAPPLIDVNELPFGAGVSWDIPEAIVLQSEQPAVGPNDIARVVETVCDASARVGFGQVRQPWLPELAPTYKLEELPTARTDRELVFGVVDKPDQQDQPVIGFVPDRDGNMAVFGTGGSGKSTFLRSIAIAGGFAPARGGPCTVYAFDFGSRGLRMLEELPHVAGVINGDDNERIVRVLRQLRAAVDERAERYTKARAGTIEEYRVQSGNRAEDRILLLIDNFGAFRQAYELGHQSKTFEMFLSIAADGRGVGVHVVLSADRPGAVPGSLGSAIQRRLVLRLSNEMDYTMLNTPDDVFTAVSPPGRGYIDDSEVQVGVLGGDPNVAVQAAEIGKLAAAMDRAGVAPVARVASLSDNIAIDDLPSEVDGQPVLGVWDETLEPIGFEPSGVFLVTGAPQSGKTNTVAAMIQSLARFDARLRFVLFGARRSPLAATVEWAHLVNNTDEMEELATDLAERIASDDPETASLVIVIEGIGELLNSSADLPLQELVKACRTMDRLVIAEGETSSIGSSWPLLQAVKASRYGIALQPEQVDGDNIFKTSFPRTSRPEFPQGRGLFVRSGRVVRVQMPKVV